ncbi:MAG: Sec-independent protein translocase protein TatB [Sphingomonas sp.]|jgi:sec-independent protein translocase protein TatB|uniref:Sec-independent protein translocase protein TatB n=1 Tax=Sphingomonas sp. TaxID=28214 RepID=UPI003561325E
MFDVASSEVILLGVVALLVIPPKDLPKAMRIAGQWVGRVRGVANQFRSGFDNMVREAELQEMEKKWAAENARIMREHPAEPVQMLPMADTPAVEAHEPHGEDAPPVTVEPPIVHAASPAIAPPITSPGDPEPRAHP